jgi:hypothetical protein
MAQDAPKEMRKQDPVMSMLTGSLFSHVGYALAKLKVAELLSGKTVYIQHLAEQTSTDQGALLQLMRTGAYLGLFIEAPPRYFALAEAGRPLLADAERSQRGSLIRNVEQNGPLLDQIMHTLHTGQSAYEVVHGKPYYERPEDTYQRNTGGPTHLISMLADYDFSSANTVVDVGGGHGYLIESILQRNDHLRGIVFDLPHVVSVAKEEITDPSITGRIEFAAGSFFESVPTGGDIYLITRVLHNWGDADALKVLTNTRAAMSSTSKLLVGERIETTTEPQEMLIYLNMHMLLLNGGRERAEGEYRGLLKQAGFEVAGVRYPVATPDGRAADSVIEALPK